MAITYKKYHNDVKNRVEYMIIDFDYYDGNDFLADIFHEKYGFSICDVFDGIWFRIVYISLDDCIYELLWDEDIGNSVYCKKQSTSANDLLEERLKNVIDTANKRMQL